MTPSVFTRGAVARLSVVKNPSLPKLKKTTYFRANLPVIAQKSFVSLERKTLNDQVFLEMLFKRRQFLKKYEFLVLMISQILLCVFLVKE